VAHSSQLRQFSGFVLTVSDRCARGESEDLSGPAIAGLLREHGFMVDAHQTVADEQSQIEDALRAAARSYALIVTTGGTGLTARDVTPEATRAVCSRLLDGVAEQMRREGLKETPFAVLSRGVCGILGQALVVNVPGAPRGAVTSLRAALPVLAHALHLLADPASPHRHPEPHAESSAP
jgi:molybdenum cofactor synthesis domain-containing protein